VDRGPKKGGAALGPRGRADGPEEPPPLRGRPDPIPDEVPVVPDPQIGVGAFGILMEVEEGL